MVIVHLIVLLTHLPVTSSLSLDMGYFFFFGGLQHPLAYDCSTANCNFVEFTRSDERTSFYSAILKQKVILSFTEY